jgi:uncharacterized protein YuzE
MKVTKSLKLDCAYIQLRKGRVAQTIELRPGILFDLDKNGEVIGIEVLSLEKLAPLLEVQKRKVSRTPSPSRRAS